jgi:hypothetical protein
MTFINMARGAFKDAGEHQLDAIALAMEEAYCAALRRCAWRCGGIDYLFEDANARPLREVIEQVQRTRATL